MESNSGFGYLPVPVRLDVSGLPMALSLTFNVPVLVPVAVGVNSTLMVQVDFPTRLVPHVVAETLKSPVVEIAILVSATFCLLERVNTFAGLLVPTFCVGYTLVAGVSVAWAVPVPESGTVCGLFEALSVSVKVPARSPSCVGVKVTLIWQLFPAARVLPQGFKLAI